MKLCMFSSSRFAAGILAALLCLAVPAVAGPPLICHTIDIGSAQSLPWTSTTWNLSGHEKYDVTRLVADTLTLLNANTPVLVRMETLRRATLYAFAQHNSPIAKELLLKLEARRKANERDALAAFDVGYLVESYKEANWLLQHANSPYGSIRTERPNPATGVDGYGLVKKAISMRGQDAEMEFAAALIVAGCAGGSQTVRLEHLKKALAGAKEDPLLAQNLTSHEMIAKAEIK